MYKVLKELKLEDFFEVGKSYDQIARNIRAAVRPYEPSHWTRCASPVYFFKD